MTREELNQEKQQEIFSEERHEKRKKITIFIFKLCFFIVVGFIAFYVYTTFVSSKVLSVKEHRIVNEKLPDNFNGLKVLQFSDLHYGTTIFKSELKKLVKEINKRSPDLVVFTGDLIDKNYELNEIDDTYINEVYKNLDIGIFISMAIVEIFEDKCIIHSTKKYIYDISDVVESDDEYIDAYDGDR